MGCLACEGAEDPHCPVCRGGRTWALEQCPRRMLDQMTADVAFTAGQLEAGLGWPDEAEENRGWLNQPASLVKAVGLFKRIARV